jgi:Zn-dependent protease
MNRSIKLGTVADLELKAQPTVAAAFLAVWSLLTLLGVKWLRLKPQKAAAVGLVATLLHWFSTLWHHLGHARAAEQTGYPMAGIAFWGPLATSLYPHDEGAVAPALHVQRALGGPLFSLLLGLAAGLAGLLLRPFSRVAAALAGFTAVDNLLAFTLGALLPLKFTDGGAILAWWGKGQRRIVISEGRGRGARGRGASSE